MVPLTEGFLSSGRIIWLGGRSDSLVKSPPSQPLPLPLPSSLERSWRCAGVAPLGGAASRSGACAESGRFGGRPLPPRGGAGAGTHARAGRPVVVVVGVAREHGVAAASGRAGHRDGGPRLLAAQRPRPSAALHTRVLSSGRRAATARARPVQTSRASDASEYVSNRVPSRASSSDLSQRRRIKRGKRRRAASYDVYNQTCTVQYLPAVGR